MIIALHKLILSQIIRCFVFCSVFTTKIFYHY